MASVRRQTSEFQEMMDINIDNQMAWQQLGTAKYRFNCKSQSSAVQSARSVVQPAQKTQTGSMVE